MLWLSTCSKLTIRSTLLFSTPINVTCRTLPSGAVLSRHQDSTLLQLFCTIQASRNTGNCPLWINQPCTCTCTLDYKHLISGMRTNSNAPLGCHQAAACQLTKADPAGAAEANMFGHGLPSYDMISFSNLTGKQVTTPVWLLQADD